MDTKELKKELMQKFYGIRAVRKGVGSCVGYISVCCATYDDQHKTYKTEIVRDFLKGKYPELKFQVY